MTQRRENGLLADAYVPLILLSPSHADHMLEALRRSGIAAYAVPLDEDVLEPAGGSDEDPPTDHLYVDADERSAAEHVLGAELPGLDDDEDVSDLLAPRGLPGQDAAGDRAPGSAESAVGGDLLDGPLEEGPDNREGTASDDEVWKDLVARFYDTASEPDRDTASWPDAENIGHGDREDDSPANRIGDLLASRSRRRDERDDRDEDSAEEDEERAARRAEEEIEGHYEPPPPPPLLQGDKVGIAAWFGLLTAPVVLFGSAFLGISLPNWIMLAAVVAFLTSFVVLVLRMTDSRPPGDNGPDNGAVV
ncbi:hypothetical protein [Nocardiopsis salina]|uniref:hypothetical protein n=1 Tax=Nocardiopsis salina TaxID=245836 RepID=UPI00034D0D89|nr:hypothetical protein [Nocardiopsis salina]